MSEPSLAEERFNYYSNELRSRFNHAEMLTHFCNLMRKRIKEGDEVMIDWALDYMVQYIDIADVEEELTQALMYEEIDI